MTGIVIYSSIVLLLAFASIFPTLRANIYDHDDEVWRRRAEEAWNRTLESYEPEPEKIVAHMNRNVHRTLKEIGAHESNGTRRMLKGKRGGACMATNPIDKCWRCQANWAENRFRLADCGMGFGYKAKGGKNGRIYVVTDPSDNDVKNPKNGTLRHAVVQKEPLWIIFAHDMSIRLQQELIIQSDKTIDARGAKVHIAYGAGFTIQHVRNIIIHGLQIHDIVSASGGIIRDSATHFGFRTESDGDGISILGSQDIWIDHVSMKNCTDGLIDATVGSTGITISNGHFTDHNKAMLFGHDDGFSNDAKMQITVAFNHFGKRITQRMPRCRWGFIHVVNNDYTHWTMYAIGGSAHPTIISQGNRYIAPPDNRYANQVTKREKSKESEWSKWTWRSEGDIFFNGAYFVQSGDPKYTSKHKELYDGITATSGTRVIELTKYSGSIDCKVGRPC